MLILGIESSCDETAAAVVRDGREILSNVVHSQIESITPVVEKALADARVNLAEIDAVAVTHAPGLVGALLIGVAMAKSLALAARKPLIGVDHIHGHIYAVKLACPALEYPCVSLVVSGGHTSLTVSRSEIDHELVGATQDDAAGEAFDKVAKLLGLGFPGGPAIENAARGHDPSKVAFKRSLLDPGSLDFSFSGIKTGVLYHARGQDGKTPRVMTAREVGEVCAGFQEAIVDVLVEKTMRAVERTGIRRIAVGGGVACNSRLREKMAAAYCTDNAAMIAGIGYHLAKAGRVSELTLDAVATKTTRSTKYERQNTK